MNLVNPQQLPHARGAAKHFLERVDELIDWSQFAEVMEVAGARIGTALPLAAVKIALLKHWYGLGDAVAAVEVFDRLSFRAFVGYAGDGSSGDVAIEDELREGFWGEQPEMELLVEAVELQLRDQGYAIRSGQLAEPSIVPCTESGDNAPKATSETTLYQPGELGRMVEAVTAKAHAQGHVATATPSAPQAAAISADFPRLVTRPEPRPATEPVASGEAGSQGGRVRAVLDWPWGEKSELAEHLNIGREFGFSPYARELTPYTHVSRKHAELLVYGDGVWIRDLGSRNGTYVNNDEVPKGQAYLIDSDSIIRFGPLLAVSLKLKS